NRFFIAVPLWNGLYTVTVLNAGSRSAHVHRNTVSRLAGSESVQKYLRDALRVIRAATDISGDVRSTLFWYRNEPLPTFGYKTAEELISEGRTEDLLRYVTSLEAGAAG
ncbi:MbcA/ParS/Xre antitoxin family protein, partial [Burkholderia stagnalis]|uniref:MbcA/ParS/Xre antitoxin family protein n=1 Tax=Burkholderia stagnalis TaxID=1503054 RepID=UPI000AF670AB